MTFLWIRCHQWLVPMFLALAAGAILVEAFTGLECCPVRIWAMGMVGAVPKPCGHQHKERENASHH